MRNMIFAAVVGAALVFAVGAALPLWDVPTFPGIHPNVPVHGPLWQAVDAKVKYLDVWRRLGADIPLVSYVYGFVLPVVSLLAAGAVCGLVLWITWRTIRQRMRG
jgi:hypothetical protein